ncbi:hypothetical protein GMORB2_0366 [Geosmithia morbida]|uniref:Zn(2)-C6 fungal-type domain-containing protein n=1 Tax=Geosmithia morbida TaxID=1094350 RepID=A0A9P4Z129_9HYPO|nr:uncharacterized protein GMORB2_0366 [Geosmithia morbida]KAF4126630.1 hypothetical protein GMORB2_0366 [Geosmithia morbida]
MTFTGWVPSSALAPHVRTDGGFVKCDERPRRCGNCERLKLDCAGYGVRLQWTGSAHARVGFSQGTPGAATIAAGRVKVEPCWHQHGHYSLDEIDEFLTLLEDDVSVHCSGSQRGPFTTFQSLTRIGAEQADRARRPTKVESDPLPDAAVARSRCWTHGAFPSRTEARSSRMAGTGPSGDSATTGSSTVISLSRYQPSAIPQNSAAESRDLHLMHHYIVHIAGLLIPVEHPMNPYRNLYVPAALAAASRGQPPVTGNRPDRPIVQSVLMHSLLASSAYHLWNCLPDQTQYHRIGSQHRHKALALLQSAINLPVSEEEYQTMLMAMLSLVSVDVMSGCEADYAIHLRGTKQLRHLMRRSTLTSHTTRQLDEISDFLSLLVRCIPSTAQRHADLMVYNNVSSMAHIGQPDSCVFYMYGVTPQIAASIQETCQIAESLAWYRYRGQRAPQSLVHSATTLHRELLCWSLEGEAPSLSSIGSMDMRQIFRYHAKAWHQAAVVYYNRRIRRLAGAEVGPYIDAVARNMQAVEDVKSSSASCSQSSMAPITWPAFVASCEAAV